jgi:predicted alpha/beta-fold hydrolase
MRRTARLAQSRGFVAVRMNLRNCGGSEALSRTLYNAGQSGDAARVLEHLDAERFPRPFGAAGFSMGGNLLLRHAGKDAPECRADTIVAVNPPVDLDACLRALERPENRVYHVYFTRRLCGQIRRIRRIRPVPGPDARASKIGSLRRFDGLFTAPDAGYPSAETYYSDASAGPYLSRISVPTLVLSAANDPFIPLGTFERYRRENLLRVRFEHPAQGGHVGYWQTAPPRFWAAGVIVDALDATGRENLRRR